MTQTEESSRIACLRETDAVKTLVADMAEYAMELIELKKAAKELSLDFNAKGSHLSITVQSGEHRSVFDLDNYNISCPADFDERACLETAISTSFADTCSLTCGEESCDIFVIP